MTWQWRRTATAGVLLALFAGTSGCASMFSATAERLGFRSEGRRGDDPTWEDQMRAADRFRDKGDIERAWVGYLRAWQQDPERPLARIRLAQLQLPRDPQRAAEGFRLVLASHPDDARAWAGLGVAALALGRLEEARTAFSEARKRAPDSALAHAGEATALDLLGRSEDARAALEKAHDRHPEEVWLLNNMAVSQLLARDGRGAEATLRTVLALDPADDTARNNLGLALGGQERYAEAYAVFRDVGGEQAARNNLGYVLFLNGHHAEAVREYEHALAADGEETRAVLANLNAALDAIDADSDGERREIR
jgi:Flp pilus assembly protein TadD